MKFNRDLRPGIESGKYTVSVGGHPARIVCWDYDTDKLLVLVMYEEGGTEDVLAYNDSGEYVGGGIRRHDLEVNPNFSNPIGITREDLERLGIELDETISDSETGAILAKYATWEPFRREAAMRFASAIISNPFWMEHFNKKHPKLPFGVGYIRNDVVESATSLATELIKQLRGDDKED